MVLALDGREDVNDESRSGRSSTSTTDEIVEAVKKTVLENRRFSVREIVEDIDISVSLLHTMFSDVLGMRRGTDDKKNNKNFRTRNAQELLNDVNADPDLLRWVYQNQDLIVPMEDSGRTTVSTAENRRSSKNI